MRCYVIINCFIPIHFLVFVEAQHDDDKGEKRQSPTHFISSYTTHKQTKKKQNTKKIIISAHSSAAALANSLELFVMRNTMAAAIAPSQGAKK